MSMLLNWVFGGSLEDGNAERQEDDGGFPCEQREAKTIRTVHVIK